MPRTTGIDRSLALIGVGVLAVVVAAVVAVLLLGDRQRADLEPGSPEATVQDYVDAFESGDHEAAYRYFSSDVQDEMSLDEYERLARDYRPIDNTSRRILFDDVVESGDSVEVHLTVEEFYAGGGPFGGGETYRSSRHVRLVRDGGEWRIDDPLIGLDFAPPRLPDGG